MKEVSQKVNDSIHVGHTRLFDDDPRFGFVALSEIGHYLPVLMIPESPSKLLTAKKDCFFMEY